MCRILLSILTDLGWKDITIATSGKDTLTALGKKPFDVVLLDNNMPGMGGLDVLDEVFFLDLNPKQNLLWSQPMLQGLQ